MTHRLLLTLLPLLLLAGCKHDRFTLSGTIEGGNDHSLWLEELSPGGPRFIDSIPLASDGSFSYSCPLPYQSLYNLHATPSNYIVVLPDFGDRIHITGQLDNLPFSYTVEGSSGSDLLWQLQQNTNAGAQVLRLLVDSANHFAALLHEGAISQAEADSAKSRLDKRYRETYADQLDFALDFIERYPGSLATLIALYKPFNNRPLVDARDSIGIAYYDKVLSDLEASLPDNPHTLHFRRVVDNLALQAVHTAQ